MATLDGDDNPDMLTLAATELSRPHAWMARKPESTDRGPTAQYGRALRILRLRAKMTQVEAAEIYGVSPQAWQNYEGGKRRSVFQLEDLPRLSAAVKAPPEMIVRVANLLSEGRPEGLLSDPAYDLDGEAPAYRQAPPPTNSLRAFAADPPAPTPGLAPVYGIAMAGPSDAVVFTPDEPDDWMPPHPNQVGRPGAFYVRVMGDSVSPRFESGELAPAIRNRPPRNGQACVIETTDDAMLVKFFLGRNVEGVRLLELQPERREFVLPYDKIRAIHAIVGGAV